MRGDLYAYFDAFQILELNNKINQIINLSSHDALKMPSLDALSWYDLETSEDKETLYFALQAFLNLEKSRYLKMMKN